VAQPTSADVLIRALTEAYAQLDMARAHVANLTGERDALAEQVTNLQARIDRPIDDLAGVLHDGEDSDDA
jgi:predicted transcriptional regulator